MARSQEEVELEIDAFMGPHIKRARIVLALAGVLYVIAGYFDYNHVADAKHLIDRAAAAGASGPVFDEARRVVSNANLLVITSIAAGVINIVLSAIGSQKKLAAFYGAVGVFGIISVIQLVLTNGALLFSWIWWLTAISVGLGAAAAHKASRLRRETLAANA